MSTDILINPLPPPPLAALRSSLPTDRQSHRHPCLSSTPSHPPPDPRPKEVNPNPVLAESLVYTASLIIESIWLARPAPTSTPPATCPNRSAPAAPALAPLTRVIQELLRRSRTSCSTFQLSLLYLIKLRNALLAKSADPSDAPATSFPSTPCSAITASSPIRCGRRMFLAALVLANKYLQDKNYSMKAWSKICGLPASELCANERLFLAAVDYDLYVPLTTWARWSGTINKRAEIVRERRERENRTRSLVGGWLQGVSAAAVSDPGVPPSPPCYASVSAAAQESYAHYHSAAAAVAVVAPLTPPQEQNELASCSAAAASAIPVSRKRARSPAPSAPAHGWTNMPSPCSDAFDAASVSEPKRICSGL